jgi:hypothetical protein
MIHAEINALTAAELAQLGGGEHDIAELVQLEKQLEEGRYTKLEDNSLEGSE